MYYFDMLLFKLVTFIVDSNVIVQYNMSVPTNIVAKFVIFGSISELILIQDACIASYYVLWLGILWIDFIFYRLLISFCSNFVCKYKD